MTAPKEGYLADGFCLICTLDDLVKAHVTIDTLTRERDELQQTFNLRWKADMRAIKTWQAVGEGRELTWPDHADLCVFLPREREEARNKALEEAAHEAEMFSLRKRPIHPDIAWDDMDENVKIVAHMTCQNIAYSIRALKGEA